MSFIEWIDMILIWNRLADYKSFVYKSDLNYELFVYAGWGFRRCETKEWKRTTFYFYNQRVVSIKFVKALPLLDGYRGFFNFLSTMVFKNI